MHSNWTYYAVLKQHSFSVLGVVLTCKARETFSTTQIRRPAMSWEYILIKTLEHGHVCGKEMQRKETSLWVIVDMPPNYVLLPKPVLAPVTSL